MISATWPMGVRRLAESYMDNPVQVYVGSLDLAAVHSVVQTVLILEDSQEEKFRTVRLSHPVLCYVFIICR